MQMGVGVDPLDELPDAAVVAKRGIQRVRTLRKLARVRRKIAHKRLRARKVRLPKFFCCVNVLQPPFERGCNLIPCVHADVPFVDSI
ncbi:hypothetical protein SDC9_96839 [bioreactor metagenome]|uniref:Uncharacterized protein n=1 Tax=bioreactor metagenome TaxID=1076179 RepID=A0A645AKA9_9ZZZZ